MTILFLSKATPIEEDQRPAKVPAKRWSGVVWLTCLSFHIILLTSVAKRGLPESVSIESHGEDY